MQPKMIPRQFSAIQFETTEFEWMILGIAFASSFGKLSSLFTARNLNSIELQVFAKDAWMRICNIEIYGLMGNMQMVLMGRLHQEMVAKASKADAFC